MKVSSDFKLLLALLTIGIVWGTTALTIRIAVSTIPPWFVSGIRQSIATFILLLILLKKGQFQWIGWKNFKIQVILGTLMLVMSNGFCTIAEQYITSSLTSLILSTTPIVVFLASVFLGFEKFTLKSVLGIALGFSGVLLIFWNGIADLSNPHYRLGILLLFAAIFAWAAGILYSKKLKQKNSNITLNMFYQFGWSALIQMIFAFSFSGSYDVSTWSIPSILCIVYLAIFGSVITFNAFFYALKRVNPSQITMLNYVNTIIAIFLGWLVLNEPITPKFILAAILIILGVFITNYKKEMFTFKRQKNSQAI